MCDTMVALGNATADGSVIFAKNSDRDPNEAHHLLFIPPAVHPEGSTVKCTYIEIPQVRFTNAVLLAKPFWIWGAEMGANDHGVVIGNEAVFTKVPYDKGPGLIGMDFIRLALERATEARPAMDVITHLLESYGQGGNCGFTAALHYHNSYLIADPREAWVLETAGKHWAAERVRDVRSISNAITIGQTWDDASPELVDYALEKGWCRRREEFAFGRCYSDFLYTYFSDARSRQGCTMEHMRREKGRITEATMMALLRRHCGEEGRDWTPARGITGSDVCMHAGFGPIRSSQSVGSLISRLTPEGHTHWVTASAAPCTGIFKPVWMDAGLPDLGPAPTGRYHDACVYWRHEALHREVLRDYRLRLAAYRADRDRLEHQFLSEAAAMKNASKEERRAFSNECFRKADGATAEWLEKVRAVAPVRRGPWYYSAAWRGRNRRAAMNA